MGLFTIDELRAAHDLVQTQMDPTPQIAWPQLSARLGCEVVVKHENAAPTGAFKVRGGITFIDWRKRTHPAARGIVTATRGNHGQSQARAATLRPSCRSVRPYTTVRGGAPSASHSRADCTVP